MTTEAKSIEAQITELLSKAAPLRSLDQDDPKQTPLAGIVEQINKLRAQQSKEAKK